MNTSSTPPTSTDSTTSRSPVSVPDNNPINAENTLNALGTVAQQWDPVRSATQIFNRIPGANELAKQIDPMRKQLEQQLDQSTQPTRSKIYTWYQKNIEPSLTAVYNIAKPALDTVGGGIASLVGQLPQPMQQFIVDRIPMPEFVRGAVTNKVQEILAQRVPDASSKENPTPPVQKETAVEVTPPPATPPVARERTSSLERT